MLASCSNACRLEGNPLCSNPYVTFHDLSCGFFSILKDWFPSANESCSGSDCKNGRMLNRKTCGCSYPLELQLILTAPTLSNLTEAIALDIETQIASKMTSGSFIALDPSQVVVDQGFSTDDVRYDLHLLFFPLVGDTLSNENETEIVMVLNQRQINISYGPFQVPYPPVTGTTCFRSFHSFADYLMELLKVMSDTSLVCSLTVTPGSGT